MNFISVIDIFAGPGGLGEGFSAFKANGVAPFHIACSVEKEASAHATLTLRAFYRQCIERTGSAPEEYYRYLRGLLSKDDLFNMFREFSEEAKYEALESPRALGEDNDSIYERIHSQLGKCGNPWVLIGGPPCQAYSLVGRSRNRGIKGYRIENDPRSGLYREYLKIVAKFGPDIFIMENVKGMLSSRVDGELVVNRILEDLSHPAKALGNGVTSPRYKIFSLSVSKPGLFQPNFKPKDFLIRSEDHGIPQARHRVILLGVREDIPTSGRKLTLDKSISDNNPDLKSIILGLPRLRSGLSKEPDSPGNWLDCLNQIREEIKLNCHDPAITGNVIQQIDLASRKWNRPRQDRGRRFIPFSANQNPRKGMSSNMANWLLDERIGGFINHETRGHIRSDLARYLFCIANARSSHWSQFKSPKLNGFPAILMPNHAARNLDKFTDRFRVQNPHSLGTTVTCHISKDGHYYIHPDITQVRSFTVREAARVQTFPDNYFFEGNRTQQYVQVGNAVPPLLANKIAKIVSRILG